MVEISQTIQNTIYAQRRAQPGALCAYIYDIGHLRKRVEHLRATLPARCALYYAMKANSDSHLLAAMEPLIDGFETASLGEIEKVRAVSPTKSIIFGGPGKRDEELVGALNAQVTLFHVESLHELQRLNLIAEELGQKAAVLLRINLRALLPEATLKMGGQATQFGIDEQEIAEAISLCRSLSHITLQGFHFHSLSNNLDAGLHLQLLQRYYQIVQGWATTYDLSISVVNVGGGLGINFIEQKQQFDWNSFVQGLQEQVAGVWPADWGLTMECGRFLVASCGYYAVEVLDIKQNHEKWFVIVAGGTHHFRLPSSWRYSHPFVVMPVDEWRYPFARKEVHQESVTVAGQLCSPKDVLASDYKVSRVRIGDILVFPYTGAYAWSISHHDFLSHPHPEMIYLME